MTDPPLPTHGSSYPPVRRPARPPLAGSGKTFTMMGQLDGDAVGCIPRLCAHLFARIEATRALRPTSFKVEASYAEIYNEKVPHGTTDGWMDGWGGGGGNRDPTDFSNGCSFPPNSLPTVFRPLHKSFGVPPPFKIFHPFPNHRGYHPLQDLQDRRCFEASN